MQENERKTNPAKRGALIPRYFDLFQWLKDRDYAQTSGDCRRLITRYRVKCDSHPFGLVEVEHPLTKEKVTLVERYHPIKFQKDITVVTADDED